MHDAIVIGGGIAGLTSAWKLTQAGLGVAILEANSVPGGNIRTIDHEGFRLEIGPYSFLGSSEYVWKLVEELDIENLAETSSALADNRYIYRDGKLHALPSGPSSFASTRLLSGKAKLRLMAEPFVPNGAKPDDTAWEFFVRRFGKEAATYVMGPFVSGIYAGDAKLLGARAAFQKFYDFECESGSMILGAIKYMRAKRKRMAHENIKVRKGLYSFKGGLGAITAELARRLKDRLTLNSPITNVAKTPLGYRVESKAGTWEARAIVCAAPPHAAASMLSTIAPDVAKPLMDIPMSPVTLVHWSQPECATDLPVGFGFLMPRLYDLRVLGTIFSSQLFAGRTPAGSMLFTSYYGGMTDKPAMELAGGEILNLILREHSHIFGVDVVPPSMYKIIRYPSAIPQLTPDHPEKIATAISALNGAKGVILAGNYITGVGIEHAVTSGYEAAGEAIKYLGEGREPKKKEART